MIPAVRRTLGSAIAWTIGAVAAVGVGQLALAMIGEGLAGGRPMAVTLDSGVGQLPAMTAPPSEAASPTPSSKPSAAPSPTPSAKATPSRAVDPSATRSARPAPTGSATQRLLASPGGTAVAECSAAGVYLVSWSPAQGYRVETVNRGPADGANVFFQSGKHHVKLYTWCAAGVPQRSVTEWNDP